jgi:hypothetical protein
MPTIEAAIYVEILIKRDYLRGLFNFCHFTGFFFSKNWKPPSSRVISRWHTAVIRLAAIA